GATFERDLGHALEPEAAERGPERAGEIGHRARIRDSPDMQPLEDLPPVKRTTAERSHRPPPLFRGARQGGSDRSYVGHSARKLGRGGRSRKCGAFLAAFLGARAER